MDTSPETPSETRPEAALSDTPLNGPARRRGFAKADGATHPREALEARGDSAEADQATDDDEGVPQQLADMRWVYTHPMRDDRTQGQKTCRKWLRADLTGFMARKTSLEAKLMSPPGEDDYPIRLQLDERRLDPDCDHDNMVSVLIGVEGTDRAYELYLTVEEFCSWQDAARDARQSLSQWFLSTATAAAVATLAGPGVRGSGARPASRATFRAR
jgi:hypothetical protein